MNEEKFLVDDANSVKEVSVESKEPTLESTSAEIGKPEKKKRGRKPKQLVVREYYCATCRETISDLNAMKINLGDGRFAVFCPTDQKSLGFVDKETETKLNRLINKNNPNK